MASPASPATTHCSELEYLIALRSEEPMESQPRRSQRLRAMDQTASKMSSNSYNSPQLFLDTDEEFLQLAQVPPKRGRPRKTLKGATDLEEGSSQAKRRRRTQSGSRPRSNSRKSRKPTQSSAPIKASQKDHYNSKQLPIEISSQVPIGIVEERDKSIQTEAVLINQLSAPRTYVKSEQIAAFKKQPSQQLVGSKDTLLDAHSGDPQEPQAPSMLSSNTQMYKFQRINLTQTLLPDRYPPHFIHQLPPAANTLNGTIISSELQRVQNTEPDTTSMLADDTWSPSPPIVDTAISTSPSLSESLAEVFGTKKIRNILNIEAPRKFQVLELHLPAIAFMLDVELGRLRAVLEMTQRLRPEQLMQMSQESREIITIVSSSSEAGEDDAGEL